MKGETDGHRTRDGRCTGLGMEGGTDGHRTTNRRWDRWTQDYG